MRPIKDRFPSIQQYLKGRPILRKIIANSGWLTLEKILRLSIGMIVSIVLARYLGPTKFGILTYSSSLVVFLGTFVYLGLSGLIIRDLVLYPDEKYTILGTTFCLKFAGGLISFFILTILALNRSETVDEIWVIAIMGLTLLFRPFETVDFWFHAETQSRFTAISKSFSFLISSAGKLLLVYLSAGLISFACITTLDVVISSVFLIFAYTYTGQSIISWRFKTSKAITLLKQSWILILSGLLATVYLKIDQIMLRWMINSGEVGIYSVAVTISEALYFLPTAIAISIYPTLLNQKKTDEQKYLKNIQNTMDVLFGMSFLIAIFLTIFGPKIILLMYGSPYEKAGGILVIHTWAGIFIFMRSLFSKWVLVENMLVFSLVTHCLGAVINVFLNLILIKPYAGYGAAIASLVSYSVASYVALFLNSRTIVIAKIMTKSLFLPFRLLIRFNTILYRK